MRPIAVFLAVLLCGGRLCAALPSDAEIRKILADRAGETRGVGVVVGIVSPAGRRVITAGNDTSFTGESAFEIGSITKVFTALLLADMVERKELALSDPAAKILPNLRIPAHDTHPITLVDLATHTSGLPFMADPPLDAFLAHEQLSRDPGADWDYSNVGYWLLGRALEAAGGSDYETLLRTRVLRRLSMSHTTLWAKPVPGHDASGERSVSVMTIPSYAEMAAAGGLVSTTNDLLTFLEIVVHLKRSSLDRAIALAVSTRRPITSERQQALGWVVIGNGQHEILFHDGGTLGFASAMACDPESQLCVTVLMNQVGDVADIARHLLTPSFPITKPVRTTHTEIKLEVTALDAFTGKYDAPDEGTFTVLRDGDVLAIEAPPDWGLPKLQLHPETPRDFFARELPLRVSFQVDEHGRTTGMLIYPPRGQKPVAATRAR
ncbi:MAG TPA: serine hydrolase [Vicinamibacterales bacterium]